MPHCIPLHNSSRITQFLKACGVVMTWVAKCVLCHVTLTITLLSLSWASYVVKQVAVFSYQSLNKLPNPVCQEFYHWDPYILRAPIKSCKFVINFTLLRSRRTCPGQWGNSGESCTSLCPESRPSTPPPSASSSRTSSTWTTGGCQNAKQTYRWKRELSCLLLFPARVRQAVYNALFKRQCPITYQAE